MDLLYFRKCSQPYGKQLVDRMLYWKKHPKHHKVNEEHSICLLWTQTPPSKLHMAIGNFIKAAGSYTSKPKDHDPSPVLLLFLLCKQLLYRNGNGHVEQWCNEFMPKNDGTMWNYNACQPRPVSPDLFSLKFGDIFLIILWFIVDILHIWFHWPLADLCCTYTINISQHYEHQKNSVKCYEQHLTSIRSFGPAILKHHHTPNVFIVDTCSCSCSISAKRDCSWQCQVSAGCPFWSKRMECWCPQKTMGILGLEVDNLPQQPMKRLVFYYGAMTHEVHTFCFFTFDSNLSCLERLRLLQNCFPILQYPFFFDDSCCKCLFHSTSQCCRICLHHCRHMLNTKFKFNLRKLRQNLMAIGMKTPTGNATTNQLL